MMRWGMPPRTGLRKRGEGHIADCVVVRHSRYWK